MWSFKIMSPVFHADGKQNNPNITFKIHRLGNSFIVSCSQCRSRACAVTPCPGSSMCTRFCGFLQDKSTFL